ncbi:SDR family oxidoreductase [Pseudonocardia sp.]|uniref:SDR family oxidoreductase n=1 Tax=Pseudonocardia sp. TaxID=60912 RepID=UPI0026020B38|nr:SDR family oxidoreductase [Pseudonocardia sp.]
MTPPLVRFREKVCVITGAAQGIGLATARRLAAEGAALALVDLHRPGVESAARELRADGADVEAMVVDVSDAAATAAAVESVVARFGRVDVLVNNVGGTRQIKPFELYTAEEMRAEVDRSLWTALVCCHAVLPRMLEQGSGSIVNVGSNSPRGIYRVPYAAAKGGVFALTTSLSAEVARRGVRVNCVAPGATRVDDRAVPRMTEEQERENGRWIEELFSSQETIVPMGRWGSVDEQAAAIAFMASDDASFVTGQVLSVAGGLTVP